MSYFPYLVDFKNTNQYNIPYSFQYGYQCPYFLPNSLSLNEMQYKPELWMTNNEFI
jgi:hypothetical protein